MTDDINERKRPEEDCRQLASIVESSEDPIIGEDLNGTVVGWNKGSERLYNYIAEEAIGQVIWQRTAPTGADEVTAMMERRRQGESIDCRDTDHLKKEGKLIHVSPSISRIRDRSGKLMGASTIARDITKRQQAEEALKETNQRLEQTLVELKVKTSDLTSMTQQLWQTSKLATMGELAASIAHELNNPLQTISLRIDSLADDYSNDAQKQHEFKIIADEVERMGKLIGNLLQFSRHSHRQISTLDIRKEIENSLELIEYHLRAQRIQVLRDFEDTLPDIQGDRQQLRQVFLNLLTNAIDAMPDGGSLVTRVRPVGSENEMRGVSIALTDSGAGITPTDLERIWEPFFTTKPEGKGTGLGLSISRCAIEAHHGTLSIESRLGKGTTVTVFLPVANGRIDISLSERH